MSSSHRAARRSRIYLASTFPLALLVSAVGAESACSGRRVEKPVASFASTNDSGAAFNRIRDAWVASSRDVDAGGYRIDLHGELDAFIAKYPDDGLTPVARVYLALLLMEDHAFVQADAQMKLLANVPMGTTFDLVTFARARWLRLHGQATDALLLLEPKVGKNVDPVARAVFQEEIVASAIAAKLYFQAIAYMDTWLSQASEDDRDATRARVVAEIEKMDVDTLTSELRTMRDPRQPVGYSAEMVSIIVDKLARRALERQDSDLARLLLDPAAGNTFVGGDAGVALTELAESTRGLNIVEGRAIGLLLPTEQPAVLRDEATAVLRGVMWALGLPRGIRAVLPQASMAQASKSARVDPAASAKNDGWLTCPRAASLPTAEPRDDDMIRLLIRDDAGDVARNEDTLKELAGLGASVIIAALDVSTADAALKFSEARDFPVIVLAAPSPSTVPREFGFVLGTPKALVYAALAQAVPALAGRHVVAPVIDESERTFFPAHGGTFGALTLDERSPISCDVTSVTAGQPRFPIGDWQRDKIHSWLVTGGPLCAADVVDEVGASATKGVIALSLEAATDLRDVHLPPGLRVVTASTGAIPMGADDAPRDSALSRYTATFGEKLDWWTALGRDAALLARQGVLSLEAGASTTDANRVTALHAQVRDKILGARAELWSTDATGFGETRVIDRPICVMDVPAR